MIVYRIAREQYAEDLTGTGARLHGGRWNSKGIALLYTAENRALAAMELAVRIDLNDLPMDLMLVSIRLPEGSVPEEVSPFQGWDQHPPGIETQLYGSAFVSRGEDLAMRAPSVVVRGEYNVLINPAHQDFGKVIIEDIVPFFFDERFSPGIE